MTLKLKRRHPYFVINVNKRPREPGAPSRGFVENNRMLPLFRICCFMRSWDFPGAILMTTNCIQRPRNEYKENIFASGIVGWPGMPHIADQNFKPLIDRALALPGFEDDVGKGEVTVGFARNAVLGVADKVIEAVKTKAIRHFFLVAGCDGAKPGRNYYTELVEKVSQDCMVLTLACGKYRFFDKQLGDIGGIPRLLNVGINELPFSLIISWYEQKTVCVLLALLHLDIKGIRLGPSLPAFLTPNSLVPFIFYFFVTLSIFICLIY